MRILDTTQEATHNNEMHEIFAQSLVRISRQSLGRARYESVPAWQGPAFCRPYSAALSTVVSCPKSVHRDILTRKGCKEEPARPAHASVWAA